MDQYVALFKALSDPTRLRIMVLLAEKELCVCQIEDAMNLSQVKVSRHLNVLRHAGLVNSRREGLWAYYSHTKPKNCLEKRVFACFKKCLRKDAFCLSDIARMTKCSARVSNNRRSKNA
ncbi:MAG: winged helix-turn-helix transcriptional regulator [Candidatus Omnitrophica bacterium]|nr:winged helix-turn-helix transcriptional regulator [Candidatus Omnitrophota bacterium]